MHFLKVLLLTLLTTCASSKLLLAQEDGEEAPYLPSLVAEYSDRSQHSFRRLDEAIAFHWDDASPDRRIAADNFDVRWHGRIFVQGAGEYRLAVHARGEVEVKLAGKVVIPRQAAAGWVFSAPVMLEFDRHELEVSFRKTKSPAHISLFWSGPQFQLEPVPARFLMHDRKESIQNLYERGEILAAALRCAACHREEVDTKPMPAPSLLHLGGNLREEWVRQWLSDKGQEEYTIRRRMPAYGLSKDDAAAITVYLFANQPAKEKPKKAAEPPPPPPQPKPGDKPPAAPPATGPSVDDGAMLFFTRGCLACHQVHGLGDSGLFGGGDFSKIATKRPAGFFSDWLADPAKLNPDHRMPIFDLSPQDRTALDRYLSSLGEAAKRAPPEPAQHDQIAAGRKLFATHRCGSCHTLQQDGELVTASSVKPLGLTSDWSKSCAAKSDVSRAQLGYSLNKDDQQALQEFYSAKRANNSGEPKPSSRLSLIQNNCLACHNREGLESLSPNLPTKYTRKVLEVAELKPGLEPSVPAMTPPSLNSVGDKYHEEALAAVIRRQGPPLRDYLLVRMPRFQLADDELKRLVNYLVETDRIPPLPDVVATKPTPAEEAAFSLAGNRLVSTDGFGCTSCHQVGKVVPDKAPLNARGPSLSSLDKRIRKEWYDRFLRNPARIVPRMEMPSVQIPVRGVLDSKLDPQLAALWRVLATPGFEPPEPNAFRVLRASGTTPLDGMMAVTDLVKSGDEVFSHAILIGAPNRHNVLFDLESNRLVSWWTGDAARQRTKGKTWFWEPGSPPLITFPKGNELTVEMDGKPLLFRPFVEGTGRLQGTSMSPWSVFTDYQVRLSSPEAGGKEWTPRITHGIRVTEDIRIPRTGFRRSLSINGAPIGATFKLRLVDEATAALCKIDRNNRSLLFPSGMRIELHIDPDDPILPTPHSVSILADGTIRLPVKPVEGKPEIARSATVELHYSTEVPVDNYLQPDPPEILTEEAFIEASPGLSAFRLRLPIHVLPTAFTWRPDGRLLACTLAGQVYLIDDQGVQFGKPTYRVCVDGLSAPYGIVAGEETGEDDAASMDVATKQGVLRLAYGREPKISIASVVASGWGCTPDYHDWAIGLVPTVNGEYYLGLPCQQDERTPSGAKLRGSVFKLNPKPKNFDDRQRFTIEPLSTGHRFPMGLAVNKDGDLFVTDNQGNYNPFNELNHVRKGAFFGFVNAIDKKNKDYKPPPLSEPAINIPHPWTRSVNGICFLYTPEKLKKETGKEAFGPLEGQLVGCEYDTRRLIRMSLQKIGDTYQGCAYPLSKEPSSPDKGFLGPIVCAVSPRGELYVGSIHESGWGAGNNVGEIVKIKFEPEKLPCGIAEVKAVKGGFSIDFLREVDAKKAVDITNYSISSYRRISTPAYGGPDVDRRTEKINSVELSQDRRRVMVQMPELRTGGFVYEIQLKNLAPGEAEFFPAEAHFTLHGVP
jgi:mono/diheme cytochrome c family protein